MADRIAELNKWFQTPLGKRLLEAEANALQQILPHLFGYHLLQIGAVGQVHLLESSRIMHCCILSQSPQAISRVHKKSCSYVLALADALPFAEDSLDVVVLPHVLEFEDNPHEILREVERILIPEGHVVILGFNPISLWGISRWFLARRQSAPWCGHFLTTLRIKDWLALLGFDLTQQHILFFALPLHNDRLRNYTVFLEKIGARLAKQFGAVYVLVAKKRVATLTPIKSRRLKAPAIIPEIVSGARLERLE